MNDLENKNIIVTGATGGIGGSLVKKLAKTYKYVPINSIANGKTSKLLPLIYKI